MLVCVVKPKHELFGVIQRKKTCTLQSKEELVLSTFKYEEWATVVDPNRKSLVRLGRHVETH